MITLEQARQALPDGYGVTDRELEEAMAFFYFIGEQAYEQLGKETQNEN